MVVAKWTIAVWFHAIFRDMEATAMEENIDDYECDFMVFMEPASKKIIFGIKKNRDFVKPIFPTKIWNKVPQLQPSKVKRNSLQLFTA